MLVQNQLANMLTTRDFQKHDSPVFRTCLVLEYTIDFLYSGNEISYLYEQTWQNGFNWLESKHPQLLFQPNLMTKPN